jgi:hypothetical protein
VSITHAVHPLLFVAHISYTPACKFEIVSSEKIAPGSGEMEYVKLPAVVFAFTINIPSEQPMQLAGYDRIPVIFMGGNISMVIVSEEIFPAESSTVIIYVVIVSVNTKGFSTVSEDNPFDGFQLILTGPFPPIKNAPTGKESSMQIEKSPVINALTFIGEFMLQ